MRKFLSLIIIFAVVVSISGCASKKAKASAPAPEEPYVRSVQKSYEGKVLYSVLVPFMYERSFFSYYALGKKISGPDKKGFYNVEFKNGPKAGQEIKTKNILLKVRPAQASDLKKGMVVLVNYWDPREHNDNTPIDLWRKGVVYNLEKTGEGLVMLEFPFDSNDFMATKETFGLNNIWLILDPVQRDPRIFL